MSLTVLHQRRYYGDSVEAPCIRYLSLRYDEACETDYRTDQNHIIDLGLFPALKELKLSGFEQPTKETLPCRGTIFPNISIKMSRCTVRSAFEFFSNFSSARCLRLKNCLFCESSGLVQFPDLTKLSIVPDWRAPVPQIFCPRLERFEASVQEKYQLDTLPDWLACASESVEQIDIAYTRPDALEPISDELAQKLVNFKYLRNIRIGGSLCFTKGGWIKFSKEIRGLKSAEIVFLPREEDTFVTVRDSMPFCYPSDTHI